METKFNFKSAICTSKVQSERLLALGLKKETADCNLSNYSLKGKGYQGDWQIGTTPYSNCLESWSAFAKDSCWELIPAWSLHRLIEMMPKSIHFKNEDWYKIIYNNSVCYQRGQFSICRSCKGDLYEDVANCISWLIKEGCFPKEYLV